MIRIDEIYNNVFLPCAQAKTGVGLHWFDPFGSVDIQHMVNLPPVEVIADRRILFWDQEPVYEQTFAKFMRVFQKEYYGPLTLITSESCSDAVAWAQHTYGLDHCYYFFHGWAALDWYRGYNHSFLWQAWTDRKLEHRFFCPNNIVSGERNHRARLVSGMDQRDMVCKNLVSFPERCPFSGDTAQDICNRLGIPVIQNLPLVIDQGADHANNSHRIDFYNQACKCFCHIVTETLYYGRRWHLTEKTFKPIVLEQPFVLVAPQGSLEYLHSYGFKTFHSIWPETYDCVPDAERIDAVLDLLDYINSWSQSKIQDAQQAIRSVVKHNRDWFYGGFQDMLWTEICNMIDQW